MSVTLIQVEEIIDYFENSDSGFDLSFVKSIETQLRDNRTLSSKQEQSIKKIYGVMMAAYLSSECDATEADLY